MVTYNYNVGDATGFKMNFETIPGVLPEDTLFIHGNLASNRWWYPSAEIWKKKANGKNLKGSLIMAEWRGCGKSSKPNPEHVEMKRFASDYVSFLKHMGYSADKNVNVVGHSTGGLIAVLAMHQEPKMFNKAILLDPVGARGVKFDQAMTAAFEAMKRDKALLAAVIGSTIFNNNAESRYFQEMIVEDGFTAVNNVGDLVLKSLDGLDITHQAKEVKNPTLVLHGEHDHLLPAKHSQELADLLPNGKFQWIEKQGHCANVENAEKFVAIVDAYLFSTAH
ncbi:MAG: alpha/beta fold hydrolase [Pseudobdellovibrionaceae bacterium]